MSKCIPLQGSNIKFLRRFTFQVISSPFLRSRKNTKRKTKSLFSCHPEGSSKGSVSVPCLLDVLLESNAELCDINSLLVMGQFKSIHHNSTTVPQNCARMRNTFSTNMVVCVLPPLLRDEHRRITLELKDTFVTKDKR